MPTSKPRPGFSPPGWGAAEVGNMVYCGLVWLFPEAWAALAPWLATWAVVSVLYGALWRSKGYEKMVAYSSIGHMGYVLLCRRRHAFEPFSVCLPNDQPRTDLSAAVSLGASF